MLIALLSTASVAPHRLGEGTMRVEDAEESLRRVGEVSQHRSFRDPARELAIAEVQLVGVDDPLLRHDVVVGRIDGHDRSARPSSLQVLAPSSASRSPKRK